MRDPAELWVGADPAGRDLLGTCCLRATPWSAAVEWQLCQDTSSQPICAVQRMTREGGRQLTHATGAWLALGLLVQAGLAWGWQAV